MMFLLKYLMIYIHVPSFKFLYQSSNIFLNFKMFKNIYISIKFYSFMGKESVYYNCYINLF